MARNVLFLLLMLCAVTARAGCDYIAELHTDKFDIEISDGGCAGDTMITYKIGKNKTNSVPFYKECTMEELGRWFSCRKNGISPLAGATYKLVEHGKSSVCNLPDENTPYPTYRYVCVKGCNTSVPRHLETMDNCD